MNSKLWVKVNGFYLFIVAFLQLLLESPKYIIYSNIVSFGLVFLFLVNVVIFKKKITLDVNNFLYLLLSLYFILSIFWHPDYLSLQQGNISPFFLIPIMLIIIFNIITWYDVVKYIMWSFIAILILNLIFYFLNYTPLFIESLYIGERYRGNFMNPNTSALTFSFAIFFSIILFKENTGKAFKILFPFIVVFGVILILATISKKGVIFIFIISFILTFKYLKRGKFYFFLTIISILFLLSFSPQVFDSLNLGNLLEKVNGRIEEFTKEANSQRIDVKTSTGQRVYFIKSGLEMIPKKIFFGYGMSSFQYYHKGHYSHNNYIELLFNGGIIAFLLFYLRYLIVIMNASRVKEGYLYILMILVLVISEAAAVVLSYKIYLYTLLIIDVVVRKEIAQSRKQVELE